HVPGRGPSRVTFSQVTPVVRSTAQELITKGTTPTNQPSTEPASASSEAGQHDGWLEDQNQERPSLAAGADPDGVRLLRSLPHAARRPLVEKSPRTSDGHVLPAVAGVILPNQSRFSPVSPSGADVSKRLRANDAADFAPVLALCGSCAGDPCRATDGRRVGSAHLRQRLSAC